MLDNALAAGWGPQPEYKPPRGDLVHGGDLKSGPHGKNLTRGFRAVFKHQFPQNVPSCLKPEISVSVKSLRL